MCLFTLCGDALASQKTKGKVCVDHVGVVFIRERESACDIVDIMVYSLNQRRENLGGG